MYLGIDFGILEVKVLVIDENYEVIVSYSVLLSIQWFYLYWLE